MSEWISVKDRLPPLSRYSEGVLCYCRIYGRFIGHYVAIGDTHFGQWVRGEERGVLPPTHWMNLPEPPEGEK